MYKCILVYSGSYASNYYKIEAKVNSTTNPNSCNFFKVTMRDDPLTSDGLGLTVLMVTQMTATDTLMVLMEQSKYNPKLKSKQRCP